MPGAADYTWIDDDASFASLVDALGGESALAIDTEFHRERTYFPDLALVQIGWSGGIALIDPYAVDIARLAPVLAGPALCVLHAADQDLEILELVCGAAPARLFDTQLAAGFLGWSTPSLASLLDRTLGVHVVKGDRLTDWTRRPLNADQRAYAASDVEYLLELHAVLVERLDARGRLQWAVDECELMRTRGRTRRDPECAWWKLKGASGLSRTAKGVAQSVAAWRERSAMRLNRPVRFILPDLAVLSIAQRPPKSRDDLAKVRGLDGRGMKDAMAREILDAVAAGRELGENGLRLPPVEDGDPRWKTAVTMLSAWIAQRAGELDLDTSLLATRSDLQAIAQGSAGSRLASGWRAELVGAAVRQILAGELGVCVRPDGGLDLVVPGERLGAADA